MIIAFIKPTPKYVEKRKNGGQFNGYLLIPKEYSNVSIPEPHGGEITLKITNPKDIKRFIDESATFWESGNLEHPDYSKYFCVGFDTLHIGDTWENWNIKRVWEETLRWKENVQNLFGKVRTSLR